MLLSVAIYRSNFNSKYCISNVYVVSEIVGEPTEHLESGDDGGWRMARALKHWNSN